MFGGGGGGCEMRWISGEDTFTQCLRLVRFLKGGICRAKGVLAPLKIIKFFCLLDLTGSKM